MKIHILKNMAVICGLSMVLCGCGKAKLEQPYSFEERSSGFYTEAVAHDRTEPFAADLCVITGEEIQDPDVDAEAAAVFDITDKTVVYSHHALERLYPASTTKIMTALIAVKYGNLSDMVTVTEESVITESGATLCHVKPGDQLTLEQLLYGLMLPSGNDAGNAIAVHMAGSVEAFAELMNQEARSLGATGTHFKNPHGLHDPEHYTTAYDLYLIFQEALRYEAFRTVTGTTSYVANYTDGEGNPVSQTWTGGNWYLTGEREEPEGLTVFSGKTGTTNAAGYCLVMASQDTEEKEYISIVLKAGSRPGLYENMGNIIGKIVN